MTEVLNKLADKLGVLSPKVVTKANEYYRRVSAKSTVGLSNFSDSAKMCVLLHVASEELSLPLDKKLATKLSCLTRPAYLKLLQTMKSLLNAGTDVTIPSLCSTLGVSEASALAVDLLKKYEAAQTQKFDPSLPIYACAAVLAATKVQKLAVDKSHLKEQCRVKWTTVQKVSADMLEKHKQSSSRRNKRKIGSTSSSLAAIIEEKSAKLEERLEINQSQREDPEDDYEAWKKRILEQAQASLMEENTKA